MLKEISWVKKKESKSIGNGKKQQKNVKICLGEEEDRNYKREFSGNY